MTCVIVVKEDQGIRFLFSDGYLLVVDVDEPDPVWTTYGKFVPGFFETWVAAHEENGWRRLL